jgi:type IV pilus assembly protein PilC
MPVNFSPDQIGNDNSSENPIETSKLKQFVQKIDDMLLKLSRVPLKERLFFVQHLGLMLKAGISLSTALQTLSKQTKNKFFIKILDDLSKKVESGKTFAESLAKWDYVFGEMFISMIEAGEISGKLEEVLGQLFIQMKKDHQLISKVKGALTYPAVILIAMGGIGTFMMIVVVPKITVMFKDMDAELPLATKIVIKISDTLRTNGIMSVIILVLAIIIISKILKTEKGKYYFQLLLLNSPIFGPIAKKINLARFARNISSLLKTDIPIIKTFQITAQVLGNVHYRAALLEMAQKIKKGGKLGEVINSKPKLFPPIVAQMVSIGEETGELDNILVELAEFYEEEVDQVMENMPTIIEPVLILFMGVAVGGVAVAIIMPMYALTSAI